VKRAAARMMDECCWLGWLPLMHLSFLNQPIKVVFGFS
jgi:hypothetical protein